MNNNLKCLLLAFSLILNCKYAFAQVIDEPNCQVTATEDPCVGCRGKSFPYRVCYEKDGKIINGWICTCNPKRTTRGNKSMSLYLANIPIKICYNKESAPDFVKGHTLHATKDGSNIANNGFLLFNGDDYNYTVFDEEKLTYVTVPTVQDVCDGAAKSWNDLFQSLCGSSSKTGQNIDCPCITVEWSSDEAKMIGTNRVAHIAVTEVVGSDKGSCSKADCNATKISLNATSAFLDGNGTNEPSFYFMNDKFKLKQGEHTNSVKARYNLFNALEHELGHILGFGHPNGVEGCSGPLCNKYKGIMDKATNDADDIALSDNDKCMMRLAYCDNCPVLPEAEEKCITGIWDCIKGLFGSDLPIDTGKKYGDIGVYHWPPDKGGDKDRGDDDIGSHGVTIKLPIELQNSEVNYRVINAGNMSVVGSGSNIQVGTGIIINTGKYGVGTYHVVVWNPLGSSYGSFVIRNQNTD